MTYKTRYTELKRHELTYVKLSPCLSKFYAMQFPYTLSRSSAHGDRSPSHRRVSLTEQTPHCPQDRSARFTKHKYLSLLLGIERRLLDRPACCPVTISTELPRFPPIQNVKKVPVHAIKVCRGSRGIAPLILNLSSRWS
jgi:hypothetical protein